jgi:putative copper resistance protein D
LRELAKLPWATLGARLLAVPLTGAATTLPFAVIEDTAAIARTYSEFRRTLSDPDLFGAGQWPVHMELLIDRYGYLRARWIPATDGTGWAQPGVLAAEITRLNAEPRLLPPPAEHVH